MADDSDLEKTEAPSGRRLAQAREEGQVPHSKELSTFLVLIAGVGGMWGLGQWLLQRSQAIVHHGLALERSAAFHPKAMIDALFAAAFAGLVALAPFLLLTLLAAIAAPMLVGGWNFTTKPLQPDLSKLNPTRGIGRMFSTESLVELFKAMLKSVLIGGVAVWAIWFEREQVFALATTPLEAGMAGIGRLLLVATVLILLGVALLAAIDVPWQLWHHHSQLKMSREELRQEAKESEGDPHIKARIRSAQREMARKRMMAEVPKADVVVTNPTHYAVALKYDAQKMGAPRVVAKGMNLIAHNIRELADEHHVPRLEAPPLARALYKHTEIGEQIPAALYTAVAEVMAYVYQLNHHAEQGGLPPQEPADLPVPTELDPGPESE